MWLGDLGKLCRRWLITIAVWLIAVAALTVLWIQACSAMTDCYQMVNDRGQIEAWKERGFPDSDRRVGLGGTAEEAWHMARLECPEGPTE